jgi:hypothetical protein
MFTYENDLYMMHVEDYVDYLKEYKKHVPKDVGPLESYSC